MERSKYILLIIVTGLLSLQSLKAQNNYREAIYNTYIDGNMAGWKDIIDEFEKQDLNTLDQQLELLSYYYGYIGYLISYKNKDQADHYIDKGEQLIDRLIEQYPDNATLNAYKGSFMSYRMALSRAKAITLGPQSMKYIDKAITLDPNNIQALTDKGNMLYYAPGIFGGNKKKGIIHYEKAVEMMENTQQTNNWFYLNSLTSLAQRYQEMKDNAKAIKTYEKILAKEPNYKWVRDELYPAALKNK